MLRVLFKTAYRFVQKVECSSGILVKSFGSVSQFDRSRLSVKQGLSKVLLQRLDLVADRGVRHVQFVTSLAEA